jgi:hypothetical protein
MSKSFLTYLIDNAMNLYNLFDETKQAEPLPEALQQFQDLFFNTQGLPEKDNTLRNLVYLGNQAFYYFFSNQFAYLSEAHCQSLGQLWVYTTKRGMEVLQPPKVHNPSQWLAVLPSQHHLEGAARLVDECKKVNFSLTLVDRASGGRLCLPSPFSSNLAYCQESYEMTEGFNCLRFVDGGQCFFLLQWVSSADALYFPLENTLVYFAHVKETHVRHLLTKLMRDFADNVAYARNGAGFGGVIASHSRPSHFYYDVWPSLYELYHHPGLAAAIPNVIQREDHDFLDLEVFFSASQCQVLDSSQIDGLSRSKHLFFIHLGAHSHLRDRSSYYQADEALVKAAQKTTDALIQSQLAELTDCYPIIWIGVEGQKRCWLEQTEGYAHILNGLAQTYPNLGVIFDGWTLPYSASKSSKREQGNDLRVMTHIVNQLSPTIRHVCVIGANSLHKIAIGQKADFFICNFATGSLHISRILRKPGFCHLSNVSAFLSLKYAMHLHPNPHVYLLPKALVTDQEGADTMRHDTVSYSIEPDAFYGFINDHLQDVLANVQPTRARLFIEPTYSVSPDMRLSLKLATLANYQHIQPNGLAATLHLNPDYLLRTLLYGTFPFDSQHRLPVATDYFIWLREPLHRVSYHALQLAKMAESQGLSTAIADVCKTGHKTLDNYLTRLVADGLDVPFGECDGALLATALTNLEKHFTFIGLQERYGESCDLLCALTGWDRTVFAEGQSEPFPIVDGDLSDDEIHLLAGMNALDIELYQAACGLFAGRLAVMEGKFLQIQ